MGTYAKVTVEMYGQPKVIFEFDDFDMQMKQDIKTTDDLRYSLGERYAVIHGRLSSQPEIKSAIYCNHANEMPAECPCDDDCYCKEHSCRGK